MITTIKRPPIPPPPPAPIPRRGLSGRHRITYHRDPLRYLLNMAQENGDLISLPIQRKPLILLNHPHFIYQLLASNSVRLGGPPYIVHGIRYLSALLPPADVIPGVVEGAAEIVRNWQPGMTPDMAATMNTCAINMASQVLFSHKPDLTALEPALQQYLSVSVPPIWGPDGPNAVRLRQQIHESIRRHPLQEAIAHRLAEQALPANYDGYALSPVLGVLLTNYLLIGQALGWLWYEIGQQPSLWVELRQEVQRVLGQRSPTFDDLPALDLLANSLSETLRRYPPLTVLAYECDQDMEISGFAIRAGTALWFSPWVLNHDQRYFAEPFAFRPQRWQNTSTLSLLPPFPWGPARPAAFRTSLWGSLTLLALASQLQHCELQPEASLHRGRRKSISFYRPHGLPVKLQ